MNAVSKEILEPLLFARREAAIENRAEVSPQQQLSEFAFHYPRYAAQIELVDADHLVARVKSIEEHRSAREEIALNRIEEIEQSIADLDRQYYAQAGEIARDRRPYTRSEMTVRKDLLQQRFQLEQLKTAELAQSADAFYACHGRELEMYLKQLENGKLVETPYVRDKLDQVLGCLRHNYYALLHGDTGSGKTELAKLAARIFSREIHGEAAPADSCEAILLRCYRGMGTEELFGHFSLKSSSLANPDEIPEKIEFAVQQWKSRHIEASNDEVDTAVRQITESILKQTGTTISEYIFGAVYRAAKNGQVVILDEVNFAPPDMLVKLNEFLNLVPGDLVHVQEDKIDPFRMHKGFGMLCTGNIDYSGTKRYGSGRFEFEPSRLNRLTMIDYDYLPQAIKGNCEEITNPLNKQLYSIALASLLGRGGMATLPDGSMEAIWRLCKYARLSQIAFSGQLGRDDEHAFQSAGTPIEHKPEVLISPRNLVRILHDWRLDGFRYELDHYLYKHFICSTLKPADGALLYQLAQKQGFFRTVGWSEGIVELENLGGLPFRVQDPKNGAADLTYVHREQIIQAIYGEAPPRFDEIDQPGQENNGLSVHQRLEFSEMRMTFEDLRAKVAEYQKAFERDFSEGR